jgi:hypothetical protein
MSEAHLPIKRVEDLGFTQASISFNFGEKTAHASSNVLDLATDIATRSHDTLGRLCPLEVIQDPKNRGTYKSCDNRRLCSIKMAHSIPQELKDRIKQVTREPAAHIKVKVVQKCPDSDRTESLFDAHSVQVRGVRKRCPEDFQQDLIRRVTQRLVELESKSRQVQLVHATDRSLTREKERSSLRQRFQALRVSDSEGSEAEPEPTHRTPYPAGEFRLSAARVGTTRSKRKVPRQEESLEELALRGEETARAAAAQFAKEAFDKLYQRNPPLTAEDAADFLRKAFARQKKRGDSSLWNRSNSVKESKIGAFWEDFRHHEPLAAYFFYLIHKVFLIDQYTKEAEKALADYRERPNESTLSSLANAISQLQKALESWLLWRAFSKSREGDKSMPVVEAEDLFSLQEGIPYSLAIEMLVTIVPNVAEIAQRALSCSNRCLLAIAQA